MKSIAELLSGIGLPVLLTLSLAACGGGGGAAAQDPLVPKLVFSGPEAIHSGAGTAEVKLEVVNNTASTISGIQVEITFPANVAIEGGSVGSLCNEATGGDSSPAGYKFTVASLAPGEECGVFMDIYPTDGPGNKTFSAAVGSITGNSVPPNAQTYRWTWDGTGDGSGTSSGGSSGSSSSSSGGAGVDGTGIYSGTLTDSQNGGTTYGIYGMVPKGEAAIFAIYSGTDVVASSYGGLVAQSNGPMQFAADGSFVNKLFTNEIANVYTGGTYEGSENVTGTVAPRRMISGSYTSDSGRLLSGSFSAAYDAAHSEMPAALASVAGTYSFSIPINHTGGAWNYSGTLTVSSTGAITGSGAGNNGAGPTTCSYSGTTSVPDAARNIYYMILTQDCGAVGQVADLSGEGLAMLEGPGGNLRLLFQGLTDGAVAELVRQ